MRRLHARSLNKWIALVLLVGAAPVAPAQQTPAAEFAIRPEALPDAVIGREYRQQLRAENGIPPIVWRVIDGSLPPGIRLDEGSGALAGIPSDTGEFRFVIQALDGARPVRTTTRSFTLRVVALLMLEWKVRPQLAGDAISGRVALSNNTDDDFDLTLIAVAVNEIGKAFALGYQHFTLAQSNQDWEVSFSSNVPKGDYIVHVDAVAEVARKKRIYRARLHTTAPLQVR